MSTLYQGIVNKPVQARLGSSAENDFQFFSLDFAGARSDVLRGADGVRPRRRLQLDFDFRHRVQARRVRRTQ